MKNFKKSFKFVLVLSILSLLIACGGGSGGSSGGSDGTTIQGTVKVFNTDRSRISFVKADDDDNSSIIALNSGTVELIEVDDNATWIRTITSAPVSNTGEYHLSVPSGVNLAANLMVRVMVDNEPIRAFAFRTQVDINPATEFLIDKLVEEGTQITKLANNQVLRLVGYIEELDLRGTSTYDEIENALKEQFHGLLDDTIQAVNAELSATGDASRFAGDFNTASYSLGFMTFYDNTTGIQPIPFFEHGIDFGKISISTTSNTLNIDSSQNLSIYANICKDNNHGSTYHLFYESEIDNSSDITGVSLTAIDNYTLYISEPLEEELIADDDNSENWKGFRYAPSQSKIHLVNENLGIGQTAFAGNIYDLDDTGHIATDAEAHGTENQFDLFFLGRKMEGASQATLTGNYGMIYFENTFENDGSNMEMETLILNTACTLNGDGTDDCYYYDNNVSRVASQLTFDYSNINSDGILDNVSIGDGSDSVNGSGFVADNGSFFTFVTSESEKNGNDEIISSTKGIAIGVKRPTSFSTSNLAGKTYTYLNLGLDMKSAYEYMEIARKKNATVTFTDSSYLSTTGIHAFLSRDNDNVPHEYNSDNFTINNIAYNVISTGKIDFNIDIDNDSSNDLLFIGYISENADLIILKQRNITNLSEGEEEYSIAILVEQK